MKPVVRNADFIGLLFWNLSNRVVISSRHHYYLMPRSRKIQRQGQSRKNQSRKNLTRLTSEALVSAAVVEIEVFPIHRFVQPEASCFVRWTDVLHYQIEMIG